MKAGEWIIKVAAKIWEWIDWHLMTERERVEWKKMARGNGRSLTLEEMGMDVRDSTVGKGD